MARPDRVREKDTWTATLSGGIIDLGKSIGIFARLDRDDRPILIKIPSTRYLERHITACQKELDRLTAKQKLGETPDAAGKWGRA